MLESPGNTPELGERGQRIFDAVNKAGSLNEIELVNLTEACRIADRLEQLNKLITGDADVWMYVKESRSEDGPVEVIINDPMKEARMHAAALRSLLAPFEVAKEAVKTGEVPSNVANIKDGIAKPARRTSSRSKRPAV